MSPIALDQEPGEDAGRLDEPAERSKRVALDARSFPALNHFKVKDIPPAAYYIPDFISEQEEQFLLKKLEESPQPKWKTVASGRRLQYWGGTMSAGGRLLPEPLPDWLISFPDIIQRIDSFLDVASGQEYDGSGKVLGINQVLVNEYQPEQGISPHEDGPAFKPLVATLSLGSHTVLDIHHYLSATSPSPPMTTSAESSQVPSEQGRPIAAIPLGHLLLMPRSLLILSSSLYTSHLHGISARRSDTIIPRSLRPPDPGQSRAAEEEADGKGVQTKLSLEDEAVVIANADQLGDSSVLDKLRAGQWQAERGVRTSLTFRHANKVLKGGVFTMANGALRRG